MSDLSKPTAKQAREAYQKLLRSQPRRAPAKPVFSQANPLLPDVAGDETDQLPLSLHGRVLEVLVNKFDAAGQPGDRGLVRLRWNSVPVGASIPFTLPISDTDFPFVLQLPAQLTVNPGRFSLDYIVNIQGNEDYSDPQSVNIDTMPPHGGAKGGLVILPPEVEQNGITKEYLDANGSVLITIPDYNDPRPMDEIDVWYGSTIILAKLVGTITRTDIDVAGTIDLTPAHIGSEEGLMSIFYRLRDRVGNEGPDSQYKTFQVTLTPAASNLQPPVVPEHADGLVDLADAYSDGGVAVQIDRYDNHVAASDKVIVSWDAVPQPPVDVVGFPTFVNVPYSDIVGSSGPGPKSSSVMYKIVRGNNEYPEPTGASVEVDLRKPGPENPDDPPGTVNPILPLVTVQGAVTTAPNKLTPDDVNQDATASVEIYEPHVAGEVMQLYWNGVAVSGGEYRVVGTEPPGFVVPFTVPWAVIDAGGNGIELPVHYTIAHPSLHPNIDTSPPQLVEVSVQQISVPEPTFQNLDPDFDNLNCKSLVNDPVVGFSAAVRVAGGEPKLANQTLTFTYNGWLDAVGSQAKPGTQHVFNFTPTQEQAENGFTVSVPYDPPLLNTLTDWGSIEYTASIDGFPATSNRHLVRVYMALTGGATCRLP